jgi:hypothetical protein
VREEEEEEDIGHGGVDWIGLALGINGWRAVVNKIMTLRVIWNIVIS